MLPFARHWKISAIAALAALLVFQAAGWFLAWSVLQFQAKNAAHFAMRQRETPLETVTLATDFLQKIRVGKKEIWLEGQLYDIKNQTVVGDSSVLVLYHDRREEALFRALGSCFRPDASTRTPPVQHWLAQWLGTAFLMPSVLPEIQFNFCKIFSPSFRALLLLAQNAPGCFSPPPE